MQALVFLEQQKVLSSMLLRCLLFTFFTSLCGSEDVEIVRYEDALTVPPLNDFDTEEVQAEVILLSRQPIQYRTIAPYNGSFSARKLNGIAAFDRSSDVLPDMDYAIYQPIRILFFTKPAEENAAHKPLFLKYLLEEIIPEVKASLESLIRVRRVPGTIRHPRACSQWAVTKKGAFICSRLQQPTLCGNTQVAEKHLATIVHCRIYGNRCIISAAPEGEGVDNHDMVLYFDTSSNGSCDMTGTVATATICAYDSFDRPLFAVITLCESQLHNYEDPSRFTKNVAVIMHEAIHALGFVKHAFAFFRTHDGTPLTERDPVTGLPRRAPGTLFFYHTSENVLQVSNKSGVVNAKLLTTSLVHASRKQFGCNSVDGVFLENQGSAGSAFSHFEMRLFAEDLLTAVINPSMLVTAITIALLNDTGWYLGEFDNAGTASWGHHSVVNNGCNFALKKCVHRSNWSAQPKDQFSSPFCFSDPYLMCTNNLKSIGACFIGKYNYHLPDAFRYFNDSRIGGAIQYTDYCPVKGAYTNDHVSCIERSRSSVVGDAEEEVITEARCVRSTLTQMPTSSNTHAPRCYSRTCISDSNDENGDPVYNWVVITIAVGKKVTCLSTEKNLFKTVEGYSGTIQCPHVEMSCFGYPCQNYGTFKLGRCVCSPGWMGTQCQVRATKVNRQLHVPDFAYKQRRATLWLGKAYMLNLNTPLLGNITYDMVRGPLPSGLSLDPSRGVISGRTSAITSQCRSYTISATRHCGNNKFVSYNLIYLRVIDNGINFPDNIAHDCVEFLRGSNRIPSVSAGGTLLPEDPVCPKVSNAETMVAVAQAPRSPPTSTRSLTPTPHNRGPDSSPSTTSVTTETITTREKMSTTTQRNTSGGKTQSLERHPKIQTSSVLDSLSEKLSVRWLCVLLSICLAETVA